MYGLVGGTTLAVSTSIACTAVLARWSPQLGLLAMPRADRWKQEVTPNSGGIAILLGVAIPWVLMMPHTGWLGAFCLLCLGLGGFLDDRIELSPAAKIILQLAAAAALISQGVIWRLTGVNALDACLTVLWIVGITNAFNLIDNMDGVCAGVTAIVAACEAVFATRSGDGQHAILLTLIAGANIGFLVFNHSPARIFMGDCGSMFNGFALAWLSIPAASTSVGRSLLCNLSPLLVLSYPIFDTVLVSVLRWKAGRSVFIGGRDHSSHRIVSLGLTERQAARVIWMLALVPAAVALVTQGRPIPTAATLVTFAAGYAMLGWVLATQRLPDRSTRRTSPSQKSADEELSLVTDR